MDLVTTMIKNDPPPTPIATIIPGTSDDVIKATKVIGKKNVPEKVKRDEFCFVIGVFNLMFSTFLISAFPWAYWIWHSLKMVILLLYRLHKFTLIKYQYFLLDFCYIANYWTILYYAICLLKSNFIALEPLNALLNPLGGIVFRIFFTWCVGPLALSIAFFRNSLVFHSSDQIIILATHLSPNLAIYGMRWWAYDLNNQFPNTFHIACETNLKSMIMNPDLSMPTSLFFDAGESCEATFNSLFTIPLYSYFLLWTIPYALFFLIFESKALEKGGYHTMYSTMKENPMLKNLLSYGGNKFQPVIYMLTHGFLCSLSFLISPLVWNSFLLHTCYLLILLGIAVKNAATSYRWVFAANHYKDD